MAQMVYPSSERQRKLQALPFAENNILSRDLPRDTVLKGISLRLSGAVTTTYGSGTPVADTLSTFDNIIPRIDVIVNGNRTVCSVRPFSLRIQQLYVSNSIGERKASAGAAALALPTADGGFVYGTTGQITTVAETLYLPFEHVYCEPGLGRETTWLNLKGVASAEIRFTTSSFSRLLGFGNTAPVAFSASTLQIDMVTKEAQEVDPNVVFADWKRTTKEITFSAQTTDYAIDINRGNKLSGIWLFARDGAAGSATTATGKLASDLAIGKLSLKVNGQTDIKSTTFLDLQAENRSIYGINAPTTSSVSLIQGTAHMNLLARRDITTALPVMPPMVDNLQLFVDTTANVSYTNPVSLTVETQEVVEPR